MDCIDLFKRAAVALQTDSRYLVLDQTRKANDKDEELQNLIGEFNLARMDLNNEIGKSERNDARIAELNEKVNEPVRPDHGRRGHGGLQRGQARLREPRELYRCHHQHCHERRRPHDRAGAFCFLHRQLLHLRRLPLKPGKNKTRLCKCRPRFVCNSGYRPQTCAQNHTNGREGERPWQSCRP